MPVPGHGGAPTGTAFVDKAATYIGTPYVWGGAEPGGFDCSGLVQEALENIGLRNVPRTSEQQWGWVQRIPESQLQPGDLIFEQWPGEISPGHVAIYSGPGQIIQAPAPGQNVERAKWSPNIVHAEGGQIVGYGRVPGLAYTGTPVGGGGGESGWLRDLNSVLQSLLAATPFGIFGSAVSVGEAITGLANSFTTFTRVISDFEHGVAWLFVPSHWVRLLAGVIGFGLLLWGIVMMSRTGRQQVLAGV